MKFLLISSCLICTVLVCPGIVFSQAGFQRLYGGVNHEVSYYAYPAPSGGILLMGATTAGGNGSVDPVLLRLDDDGQVLWGRTLGGANFDVANAIVIADDGGVVFAGSTKSFNGNTLDDVYFFKTDTLGNVLWSKIFSSPDLELAGSIIKTADGGYAMSGYERSTGSKRVLLIRTDSNGDTLFTRSYGLSPDDVGVSLCETPDGGFMIAGKTFAQTLGESDILLLRTNAQGDLQWTKSFGGVWWDEAGNIIRLSDGNYLITGATISFGSGNFDILVMKTDSSGNILWGKTYGGTKLEAAYSAYENTDGSIVISGYTNSLGYGHTLRTENPELQLMDDRGDDSTNIFLMKLSPVGDTLWTRSYGGGMMDEAFHFSKMPDGGYLVPGYTTSFNNAVDSTQILLIRTDSLGISTCNEQDARPMVDTTAFITQVLPYTEATNLIQSVVVTNSLAWNINANVTCDYTGVNSASGTGNILLFPNPCMDYFELQGLPDEINHLEIYDMPGKKVLEMTILKSGNLFRADISSLNSGCYAVRLAGIHYLITKKIIIQKN